MYNKRWLHCSLSLFIAGFIFISIQSSQSAEIISNGLWKLETVAPHQVIGENPQYPSSGTITDGSCTGKVSWKDSDSVHGEFTHKINWTSPPAVLSPGEEFAIEGSVSVQVAQTGGGRYIGASLSAVSQASGINNNLLIAETTPGWHSSQGSTAVSRGVVKFKAPASSFGESFWVQITPFWNQESRVIYTYRLSAGSPPSKKAPDNSHLQPVPSVNPTSKPGAKSSAVPAPVSPANKAAADAVDEFLAQFKNNCFGKVVSLGDQKKYRKALTEDLEIIVNPSLTSKRPGGGSAGYLEAFDGSRPNKLVLPIDPCKVKLSPQNKKTIYHEATHQIEWLHHDRSDPLFADFKGYQERNASYLDHMINALNAWKNIELQVLDGSTTADKAQVAYNTLEQTLRMLERGYGTDFSSIEGAKGQWWPPDLRRLQVWAGIKARIEDIRNLYLSGDCGDDLKFVAEHRSMDKKDGLDYQLPDELYRSIEDGQGGSNREAPKGTTLPKAPPTEKLLLEIGNHDAVLNNPDVPAAIRFNKPYVVTLIQTYHWNNGHGANPGSIGLQCQDGKNYGPWKASGSGGQNGALNVNWQVRPNVKVDASTCIIIDSDQTTWSHNKNSGNRGFVRVEGK